MLAWLAVPAVESKPVRVHSAGSLSSGGKLLKLLTQEVRAAPSLHATWDIRGQGVRIGAEEPGHLVRRDRQPKTLPPMFSRDLPTALLQAAVARRASCQHLRAPLRAPERWYTIRWSWRP